MFDQHACRQAKSFGQFIGTQDGEKDIHESER